MASKYPHAILCNCFPLFAVSLFIWLEKETIYYVKKYIYMLKPVPMIALQQTIQVWRKWKRKFHFLERYEPFFCCCCLLAVQYRLWGLCSWTGIKTEPLLVKGWEHQNLNQWTTKEFLRVCGFLLFWLQGLQDSSQIRDWTQVLWSGSTEPSYSWVNTIDSRFSGIVWAFYALI